MVPCRHLYHVKAANENIGLPYGVKCGKIAAGFNADQSVLACCKERRSEMKKVAMILTVVLCGAAFAVPPPIVPPPVVPQPVAPKHVVPPPVIPPPVVSHGHRPHGKVCHKCHGTGECHKCDGTGWRAEWFSEKMCTRCDGTGWCSYCGGDGREYDTPPPRRVGHGPKAKRKPGVPPPIPAPTPKPSHGKGHHKH